MQPIIGAPDLPPSSRGWNNTDVTVSLDANDALSGVKATYFTLDGGAQQVGTSIHINVQGIHTLQYWSVDKAGNIEAAKSAQVKIEIINLFNRVQLNGLSSTSQGNSTFGVINSQAGFMRLTQVMFRFSW